MIFWASLTGYLFLGHFQMCILVMVDKHHWNTTMDSTNHHDAQGNYGPQYNWTVYEEGTLISSYYYGLVVMSIPGGVFADLVGPFKSILISNGICATMTCLAVYFASNNWVFLFVCRLIVGLGGGVAFPALTSLIAKWAPPKEKSVFTACTLGYVLGSLVNPPFCSLVIKHLGWQWCFYLTSLSAALFCLVWFFLVSDYPVDNWFCPKAEAAYINESLEGTVTKGWVKPPICSMLKSRPFLMLVAGHFGVVSGMFIVVTLLPKFLDEALDFPLGKIGTMAALPNVGRFFGGFVYGAAAGILLKRFGIHKKYVRKGFLVFSHFLPGIILSSFLLNFVAEFGPDLSITLIICSTLCSSGGVVTTTTNPHDLAPNYAGTQMGIIASVAGTAGFIYPVVLSKLTEKDSTILEWSILYGILGGVYLLTGTLFLVFGTTSEQPWNEKKEVNQETVTTSQ